jgi:secreted PhoX family phosphatase
MAMAIDALEGRVTELPWLGKFAHENQVVVPGFEGKTVVLATEDNSEGSQLYLYVADSPADLLAGRGQLFVFKADDAAGIADIAKGDELTGSFIPVDQADKVDAQTLETKVRDDGAFTFIRLEDLTYDRTYPNTIYFTDTGDDEAPNLGPDGTPLSLNGRLYQMTLDSADPTKVTGLTVLLDGDNGDDIHNPDNIDADASTIMLQEDTSAGVARILSYSIYDGTLTPVATVDQADSDELVDPGDEPGAWESSGIVNVSHIFGEGTWLADVQAHSLKVPQSGGEDEGGQLLLVREG